MRPTTKKKLIVAENYFRKFRKFHGEFHQKHKTGCADYEFCRLHMAQDGLAQYLTQLTIFYEKDGMRRKRNASN